METFKLEKAGEGGLRVLRGGGWGAFRGVWGEGSGIKYFLPHPNELLIWAYPQNLVEIRLMVEAVDEL